MDRLLSAEMSMAVAPVTLANLAGTVMPYGHSHAPDFVFRMAILTLEKPCDPGDLGCRNHGSVQSLDIPQFLHTILQWISSIRSPQRSQS